MRLLVHGTGVMGSLCAASARQEGWNVQCADDFTAEAGDVILSFSHFSRMPSVIEYALSHKIPLVVATTGWGEDAGALLKKASKEIPVLVASNTSLGINTLHAVLEQIVPLLAPHWDVEIIEKHHNQKLDAPSGTANSLAQTIIAASPKPLTPKMGRAGNAKRSADELGIHSLRGGTVAGEHSVAFYGEDEIFEISHSALSKKVFVRGALEAAKFLVGKIPAVYTMKDLFSTK